ncbi:MAG: metallophosphoesterase [Gammaproteobacteria bacterium]|nr:metallophosphoesterase [Gammaproteobacteria bacterium]
MSTKSPPDSLLPDIVEPIVVFGGPYGNLQALQELKRICHELNIPPRRIFCTGDLAAYCAQPLESIAFVRSWGIHVIAGNVELQLAADQADCGCNFNEGSVCDALSNKWYGFIRQEITQDQIQWFHTLPQHIRFVVAGYRCVIIHGAYTGTAKFIYHSTPWQEKQFELDAADADVILTGHCGIPFLHSQGNHIWANAGVIGMPPNDGTTLAWYLLLTPQDNELLFETRAFAYDHNTAAQRIESCNVVPEYAEALRYGIWPGNDMLPKLEKAQQGRPLIPEKLSVERLK